MRGAKSREGEEADEAVKFMEIMGGMGEQGMQLLQTLCAFGTLGPRVFQGFIFSDPGLESPGWSQKSPF